MSNSTVKQNIFGISALLFGIASVILAYTSYVIISPAIGALSVIFLLFTFRKRVPLYLSLVGVALAVYAFVHFLEVNDQGIEEKETQQGETQVEAQFRDMKNEEGFDDSFSEEEEVIED